MGPFTSVQNDHYWTGTQWGPYHAWVASGHRYPYQTWTMTIPETQFYALAVRDHDVAAVPESSTAVLLGLGLSGLAAKGRRRNRS